MSSQSSPGSATCRTPDGSLRSGSPGGGSSPRRNSRSRSRSLTPENEGSERSRSQKSRSGSPRSVGSRTPSYSSDGDEEAVQERKGINERISDIGAKVDLGFN